MKIKTYLNVACLSATAVSAAASNTAPRTVTNHPQTLIIECIQWSATFVDHYIFQYSRI